MLQGRTAVITGAADGIGLAIATRLARNGTNVVLSDIREDRILTLAEEMKANGWNAFSRYADASKPEDVKALMEYTAKVCGGIQILVNNAGRQHVDYIENFPVDTFQELVQLMLVGPFVGMKYAIPYMKAAGFGRIISIASINGLVGFAGKAAYNSAKHGVIGLTKVAALEVATQGITVNAICPGYVDTKLVRNQLEDLARTRNVSLESVLEEVIYPLVPQRRLLDPEEIADYAEFLASDKARGITGQAVVMDGGYVAQ